MTGGKRITIRVADCCRWIGGMQGKEGKEEGINRGLRVHQLIKRRDGMVINQLMTPLKRRRRYQ